MGVAGIVYEFDDLKFYDMVLWFALVCVFHV